MTQSMFRYKFITTAIFGSLLFSMVFLSCKKDEDPVVVDKTCLEDNIAIAQDLYDGTEEGTKPGQYVIGSRTDFKATLDAATTVLNTSTATQADITNACAQLEAGITLYNSNLIQEIAAANLIGFWKFNGNANDSSGKGNDGVVSIGHFTYGAGSPTLTTDRFGRPNMAYHFDHGGNIEVPYTSTLNPQEMSISIWSKKSIIGRTWAADAYYMVALNRWNGYKVQYQGANKIFFTVRTILSNGDTTYINQDDESVVLDNDVWYHVVVTYKPDEMNFYINGVLVKSWVAPAAEGTPITLGTPVNFTIGQDLPTSGYSIVDGDPNFVDWGGFFTGDLDDVMFYNVALDAPQVASIYTNQNTL